MKNGVEFGFRVKLNKRMRENEDSGVELDSDSPHQSDIDLLDSNEIKELRNDDQWNEVLDMQVSSQDETVVEPLIGEETRELLLSHELYLDKNKRIQQVMT
ncbi:hypothetical protein OUZ56_012464 [Daphnia magna]|uniref:Uncharacterized protein n=1 Tax=Daphnia magna TaxID=35525 RepID=A0ABQ9Z334_9CRUS|nr:hypothetical protein OUZ56_012464 [Daphnia magna]